MPLSSIVPVNNEIAYAIWDINEQLEELIHLLDIINHEQVNFDAIHPKRKMEFLTTRLIIKHLCEYQKIDYQGIYKDEFGKPHLINEAAHISISHSFPVAMGIINLNTPCGIDIELPQSKIDRIKHKFLSDEEKQYENSLRDISIIWSAKETLYKIHGRRSLDFRKNLEVELDVARQNAKGKIKLQETEYFNLKIGSYNDYLFTFNLD